MTRWLRRAILAGVPACVWTSTPAAALDAAKLLVFTNSERVWRDNTRGDYWVLDVNSGGFRLPALPRRALAQFPVQPCQGLP